MVNPEKNNVTVKKYSKINARIKQDVYGHICVNPNEISSISFPGKWLLVNFATLKCFFSLQLPLLGISRAPDRS